MNRRRRIKAKRDDRPCITFGNFDLRERIAMTYVGIRKVCVLVAEKSPPTCREARVFGGSSIRPAAGIEPGNMLTAFGKER